MLYSVCTCLHFFPLHLWYIVCTLRKMHILLCFLSLIWINIFLAYPLLWCYASVMLSLSPLILCWHIILVGSQLPLWSKSCLHVLSCLILTTSQIQAATFSLWDTGYYIGAFSDSKSGFAMVRWLGNVLVMIWWLSLIRLHHQWGSSSALYPHPNWKLLDGMRIWLVDWVHFLQFMYHLSFASCWCFFRTSLDFLPQGYRLQSWLHVRPHFAFYPGLLLPLGFCSNLLIFFP